jgi:amidohydrolase
MNAVPALVVCLALCCTQSVHAANGGDASGLLSDIRAGLRDNYPGLDSLYKDIHAHPELGFHEERTAGILALRMRALGFTVTEHVGKTGLVAVYRNGAGPTVMVRTELDALPMEEKTALPYASRVKTQFEGKETYVAHSCGHDVHMAAWIGTAQALVALKDRWQGTLMFVAQPAEELVSGAQAMIDDGLFTRFQKPDFAFALHTAPAPLGSVAYNVGPITSNSDGLDIVFKGRGGHGSAPDKTVDPITEAAHFIVDVQTVVSREKDPMEFGVVTVGAIQAGSAGNIIPDQALLRGTIRSYKPEVRSRLHEGVRRTALAAAAMAGAPDPDVNIVSGGLAVVNDEALVSRTEAVLKAALGPGVQRRPPISASEDFSAFVNAGIPSMFFFIGVYDQKRIDEAKSGGTPLPFNHSPYFAPVAEPSIRTGVEAMSLAVLTALGGR